MPVYKKKKNRCWPCGTHLFKFPLAHNSTYLFLSSGPLHILFVTADNASQGCVRHAGKVKTVGSIFQCRQGDITIIPLHTYTEHINLMSVVLDIKLKVPTRCDIGCAGIRSLILYGCIFLNIIKSGVLKLRSILKWSEVKWSELRWSSWRQKYHVHLGDLVLRVLDCIVTIMLVCILYCGCFNLFCNAWVCVCVGVLTIVCVFW